MDRIGQGQDRILERREAALPAEGRWTHVAPQHRTLCHSEMRDRKVRLELRGKFKEEPENQKGGFVLDTEADEKLSEQRQWFLFLDVSRQAL